MIVPGLFLIVVLGLLSQNLQARLRSLVHRQPLFVLAAPAIPTATFAAAAWNAHAGSLRLALLVLVYTLVPTLLVAWPGGRPGEARWSDMAAILALWLPL